MRYTLLPTPPPSFIKKHDHIHPIAATFLWQRGVRTKAEIEEFLNSSYYQEEGAVRGKYNPFRFKEMERVVERLLKAAEQKERVLVYGDYDADGVCSAVLLIDALERLYGIKTTRDAEAKERKSQELIQVYLPHREEEGYGLNQSAVEYIKKQEVALVITCDCGSTNVEELHALQNAGIDTIVLDHHVVPETRPPVYGFINPKYKQEAYPFAQLAACGVVFKVVQALRDHLQKTQTRPAISEAFEKWSLDLVAIATVADMMPLKGENRILVKWGLVVLNKTRRISLQALIAGTGLKRRLSTYEIGFVIAPRLNAAGRLDHANVAFDLLRQKNKRAVLDDVKKLNHANEARQKVTETIFKEACSQIKEQIARGDKILVAHNLTLGRWQTGVVGLVAGKLVQEYHRPVFVIGMAAPGAGGSGRSIPGFDITKMIQSMGNLFAKSGGHPAACGFTFKDNSGDVQKHVQEFKRLSELYAKEHLTDEAFVPRSEVDLEISFAAINWKLIKELSCLEPFGEENREPLFITRGVLVESARCVGTNGDHCKMLLSRESVQYPAIMFRGAKRVKELKQGDFVDITYSIEVNEWRGSKVIQLVLKGLNRVDSL